LNDRFTIREVYNRILGRDEVKITSESIATHGAALINEILSATNKWTLGISILELRILFDEWSQISPPEDAATQLVSFSVDGFCC
jgi:hypothetical protein